MIKIIKSESMETESIIQKTITSTAVTTAVAMILANVMKRGDEALREYTEQFDECVLDGFDLSRDAMDEAIRTVEPEFIKTMERAAQNIEDFHRSQIRASFDLPPKDGIILGQKITPIERVGVYIPGGRAPYPSSVLMNCIPAKIAGVGEIVITTPPSKNGSVNSNNRVTKAVNGVDARVLAAAKIAGVDKVFTIGGAQAIAALAYGTETVPSVDKITGPGNVYVSEAKRQVFGTVGIDMIAGPSDILIIADSNADPKLIAADMLSQCEHGPDSPAILITNSAPLAEKVRREIEKQLVQIPRAEIARNSIKDHSLIIITKTIDEALEISNKRAPEHLEVHLKEPFNYLDKITNAGSVFLGKYTPCAIGDYYAGPNHTLPTSGTARFSSPLTIDDFIKKTSYTYYTEEALQAASTDVIRFAEEEGLRAHALSIQKRLNV